MAKRPSPAQSGNTTKETAMHPDQHSADRTDSARPPGTTTAPPDLTHRRHREKQVSWTGPERLRCLWYRLRLTVAEMNYATRRAVEVQAPRLAADPSRGSRRNADTARWHPDRPLSFITVPRQ